MADEKKPRKTYGPTLPPNFKEHDSKTEKIDLKDIKDQTLSPERRAVLNSMCIIFAQVYLSLNIHNRPVKSNDQI